VKRSRVVGMAAPVRSGWPVWTTVYVCTVCRESWTHVEVSYSDTPDEPEGLSGDVRCECGGVLVARSSDYAVGDDA
jgi:hypothetical protein